MTWWQWMIVGVFVALFIAWLIDPRNPDDFD